jgi:hypothetical protein
MAVMPGGKIRERKGVCGQREGPVTALLPDVKGDDKWNCMTESSLYIMRKVHYVTM